MTKEKDVSLNVNQIALLKAAREDNLQNVNSILPSIENVNFKDAKCKTPLIYAARIGNLDMVRSLIEVGAERDVRDISGNTALMYAVAAGHIEIVRYLIEAGASVHVLNNLCQTAFVIGLNHCCTNKARIISVLLRAGAIFDEKMLSYIDQQTKEVIQKFKSELSDPRLKALRNVKEGKSTIDSLTGSDYYDVVTMKSNIKTDINTNQVEISKLYESLNDKRIDKASLFKMCGLDVSFLSKDQIAKLIKTANKIILKHVHKGFSDIDVVIDDLAEKLAVKTQMLKIKNSNRYSIGGLFSGFFTKLVGTISSQKISR